MVAVAVLLLLFIFLLLASLPLGSALLLLAITWALVLQCGGVGGVELTFELPDNAKECFHEIIEKDTESTLEFQVLRIKKQIVYIVYIQKIK